MWYWTSPARLRRRLDIWSVAGLSSSVSGGWLLTPHSRCRWRYLHLCRKRVCEVGCGRPSRGVAAPAGTDYSTAAKDVVRGLLREMCLCVESTCGLIYNSTSNLTTSFQPHSLKRCLQVKDSVGQAFKARCPRHLLVILLFYCIHSNWEALMRITRKTRFFKISF